MFLLDRSQLLWSPRARWVWTENKQQYFGQSQVTTESISTSVAGSELSLHV